MRFGADESQIEDGGSLQDSFCSKGFDALPALETPRHPEISTVAMNQPSCRWVLSLILWCAGPLKANTPRIIYLRLVKYRFLRGISAS